MKKIHIVILLIAITACLIADNSLQINNTNQEAIAAYHEKNYEAALEKFTYLEHNGLINADLFYNIANCHFRLNHVGKAVLYYKKALKVQPSHQQAATNLEFMQTLIKDKIADEESGALVELLKKIYNSVDLNSSALITAILFAVLILLLILLITVFVGQDKSLPVFLIFLTVILLIISAGVSITKYNNYSADNEAVIIAQTAIGYSGPGEEYTRVFTIHEGMSCTTEDVNDSWILIKLPNGIGGWINKNLIEFVTFKKLN